MDRYMKFECKMGALKILWHFPQQANVQQSSYEMGNMKNLQE
jgi:hypothetical protein